MDPSSGELGPLAVSGEKSEKLDADSSVLKQETSDPFTGSLETFGGAGRPMSTHAAEALASEMILSEG